MEKTLSLLIGLSAVHLDCTGVAPINPISPAPLVITKTTSAETPSTKEIYSNKDIAQCLVDKGVTLYSREKCVQCLVQADYFGDAWKTIKNNIYFSCDEPNEDYCLDILKVDEFPFWLSADGKIKIGGHTKPEKLAKYFGCNKLENDKDE